MGMDGGVAQREKKSEGEKNLHCIELSVTNSCFTFEAFSATVSLGGVTSKQINEKTFTKTIEE